MPSCCHCFFSPQTREYIHVDWQWPLSCVHSAQLGEGGGGGVHGLPLLLLLPPPLKIPRLLHPLPSKTSERKLPLHSHVASLPNDDLFWYTGDRSLFPSFHSWGRHAWSDYTGCGNTQHRCLKARVLPWLPSYAGGLKEGVGEHVLHCDVSLKGLPIPRVWAKMLSCKLQSTTPAFVLYILWY